MALAQELLGILACPQCRGGLALTPTPSGEGLVCERCRLCYPVRDDIPVMLPEEAAPWPPGATASGG